MRNISNYNKLFLSMLLVGILNANGVNINRGMEQSYNKANAKKIEMDKLNLIVLQAPKQIQELKIEASEVIKKLENGIRLIDKIRNDPTYRQCRIDTYNTTQLKKDLALAKAYNKEGKLSKSELNQALKNINKKIDELKSKAKQCKQNYEGDL